jgi:hypothetical protein
MATSAPPITTNHHPLSPTTAVITPMVNPESSLSSFLNKPSQPLREPEGGCTKCVLITMIVFDSIALLFWLTQCFLTGFGSAISVGAFIIAAILSCALLCTKQGGNRSGCVCTTHILGLLSWFGGVAMLVASGFSFFADTDMENQVLIWRSCPWWNCSFSLTYVIMIVAMSCAGCALCEVNRDHYLFTERRETELLVKKR